MDVFGFLFIITVLGQRSCPLTGQHPCAQKVSQCRTNTQIRTYRSESAPSHLPSALVHSPIQGTPYTGGVPCAVHALCARCAKSWLFSTTGGSVSSEDWKDVIEWLLQWTGL